MRRKTLIQAIFRGRWKQMLVGTTFVVFLLPVPVLALTFLSPWTFRQFQVNAPPFMTDSGDTSSGGFLQLSPGINPPGAALPFATSTITAYRDFRVTNPSEIFNLTQNYNAFLQGANVNVTFRVTKLNGDPNAPTALAYARNDRAGNRFSRLAGTVNSNSATLTPGDYQIKLQVRYRKSRVGIWDVTDVTEASPHLFVITGI